MPDYSDKKLPVKVQKFGIFFRHAGVCLTSLHPPPPPYPPVEQLGQPSALNVI